MATAPTFSHVVFMTRRFEEMKAWYINVFGAEVVHGDPALAFLTYDDESHRFAIANLDVLKPDVPADSGRGEIGVNHVAYTYASAADLLETYAQRVGGMMDNAIMRSLHTCFIASRAGLR